MRSKEFVESWLRRRAATASAPLLASQALAAVWERAQRSLSELALLALGYAQLRQLHELGKLLGSAGTGSTGPAALRCLGRTVPLRIAMIAEASGGTARITAARSPGVPEAELQEAAIHARGCLSRLC